MTTTHDAGPNTDTVASGYTDSAHTEASAWASSPLGAIEAGGPFGGDLDGPTDLFEAEPEADPTPRRVGIMALAACGVALGAALAVTLFGYADVRPAVSPGTVPAPVVTEILTSDIPAEVPAVKSAAPGPVKAPRLTTAAPKAPAPIPSGLGAPAGPSVLPPPPPPPGAPPAPAGPTIVVDLPSLPPFPQQPEEPEQPDPEPPKPQTPPDLDIAIPMPDVPDPPKPEPDDKVMPKLQIKPVPPTIGPALPPVVSAS
jgi:hypothetical protein